MVAPDDVPPSPSFLEDLLDASPDLFFFKDTGGIYRMVNKAVEENLGLSRGAIVGRDDFALFPEPLASQHHEADLRVMASGRPAVFEYEFPNQSGQTVWLEVRKSPVRGPQGKAVGVFCMARNITEAKREEHDGRQLRLALEERVADRTNRLRRANAKLRLQIKERHKAEQALADSARTLNLILDNSPIGISFVVERTVRWANPRFHELFARPPGSMPGLSTAVFYPDRDSFEEFGQLHYPQLARGERVDVTWTMRRGDGTDFLCRVIGRLLHADKPHGGSIWLMEDVTERRLAEEASLAAERLKQEFVDTMSHEIRTPVNGIAGMTALLAATSLTDEQRDYVDDLQTSVETLTSLIENLLDFARLDRETMPRVRAPFSPAGIVAGVVRSLAGSAQHKGLELGWSVAPGVPAQVLGDADGIRRILAALASNAVKFTERGAVRLTVECREAPSSSDAAVGPTLEFAVSDTGIGLTPEQLRWVFEPFRQADGGRTRHFGGAGLGLAIASRTATAMGGEITATSTPGQGSTFLFTVTLDLPPAPSSSDGR